MTDAQERRREVALKDRELRPLFVETRPTLDQVGVLFAVTLDEGQRPITDGQQIEGRLTEAQAVGLIRSLQLMLRLSREEQGQ